jgi:hypothetical protein
MLDESIRAFLQQRLIARVTTMGPDGYPHTTPIWYILDGDDILISTSPDSRKVKNIQANPKGAVCIGGDPIGDHEGYTTGYLFQGEWSLEGEPEFAWIIRIALRYWGDPAQVERDTANWAAHQVLRFKINKVIKVWS